MNQQLYKKLAKQIVQDYSLVGTLPGERALAEHYACTRSTIRAALRELQREGVLSSDPRRGHQLVSDTAVSIQPVKAQWNLVMLVSDFQLQDQNFLDFIGGAIHEAARSQVNLIIREIGEATELSSASVLEKFHPGIEADGYLLTDLSERLRGFLENQLKPCVVLGADSVVEQIEKRRFIQVGLPNWERYHFILEKLLKLGHRRILWASNLGIRAKIEEYLKLQKYTNVKCDFLQVKISRNSLESDIGRADQVFKALPDYTALIVPFGGATGLDIYRRITASGVAIPQRLSLMIDSGRFDYFIQVFKIDSTYSSAWEEGGNCIHELISQLHSGELRFGCRISSCEYRQGESIARAMTPQEMAEYDRTHPWYQRTTATK